MKNRLVALIVTLFLFQGFTMAQQAGDVSATLEDSKTKEPIAFATVELLSTNDSLLTGCITDSKGYFHLTPPAASAKIRIRYMGYKPYESAISNKELKVIYLEEDVTLLNEVRVKGSAKTNKIDRDVFAITKELRAGTTSSQELLGKLSGVHYNVYDRSISVNGSTNVLILVDGIEKDQQYAKNLQPERIERVEVIKDPIGKYATEGYTAVINIVMRKDYIGVDATISNSAFFDFSGQNDSRLIQDYGFYNLTYSNRKLNAYTSGSFFGGNFNLASEYTKTYGNSSTKTQPMDVENPNMYVQPLNFDVSFGTDYNLNKNHVLSAEIKYSSNYTKFESDDHLTNFVNDTQTGVSSSFNTSKSKTGNLQAGITYLGKINQKNTFTTDIRYYKTNGYNYNYLRQGNFESLSDIDLSGDYIRSNVNYVHTFSDKLNIDLGYGNVYFTNINTMGNSSFTRYNYRNRVSLYASYRPMAKINAKVGGIVENYTQKYADESKNLTAFIPFANIQYNYSDKFNIVARYHSGAKYPTIDQLNPYKMAMDSIMYTSGNPDLKTGVFNTLGLDFNLFSIITLSPYYTFNKAYLSKFVDVDTDNSTLFLEQTVNADDYKSYGVKLDFTVPFGKKLFWKNNIQWSESTIEYKTSKNSVQNWMINSNLIYVEPAKGIVAGMIFQKQIAKDISIQGFNSNGNDIFLVMLRKSLLQQKLNVTLFYVAPLNLGLSYNLPQNTEAKGYSRYSNVRMGFIKNMTFLELSYNLSVGKKIIKKQSSTDDEFSGSKKSGFGL